MIYLVSRFFAVRASRDAASFFAKLIVTARQIATSNGLHSSSGLAQECFPLLVQKFIEQSPPTWPGQKTYLQDNHLLNTHDELVPERLFSVLSICTYRSLIINLCTTYFCSGFVRQCMALEAQGDPRGQRGLATLQVQVTRVFNDHGLNEFFSHLSSNDGEEVPDFFEDENVISFEPLSQSPEEVMKSREATREYLEKWRRK
jgi:hypothetical protein